MGNFLDFLGKFFLFLGKFSTFFVGNFLNFLGKFFLFLETFLIYRKTPYLVPGTTCVFEIFFSMVVPGTKCSQKKFEKCWPSKRGFSTGLNTQKNISLEFLEELGFFFNFPKLVALR